MNYLLDSNILSDFYNSSAPFHGSILRRFERLTDGDKVFVSVLSLYELGYGLANAPEDKMPLVRAQIRQAMRDFERLPLFPEAAVLFGELKKSLQTRHSLAAGQMRRHNIDLMPAVTAIVSDSVLVSGDRDFENLRGLHPDLRFEDWTRPRP